jgi:hypothetical protein
VESGTRSRGRRSDGDFVEALARGLEVITAFGPTAIELTVSDVAALTGLARPTARRLLITLEPLGYVRSSAGRYSLTTNTLEFGCACIAALSDERLTVGIRSICGCPPGGRVTELRTHVIHLERLTQDVLLKRARYQRRR